MSYVETEEQQMLRKQVREIGRKYGDHGYSPAPDQWEGPESGGLRVFTPVKAMAWFDFPADVTRFHFQPDSP